MKVFWRGLICGADDTASMAKCMAWLTFILVGISWFGFPDRAISELSLILGGLLGYIFSGKWAWHKYGRQGGSKDNEPTD